MDWNRISRDDWIVAGVALLLVIDLLFLPWLTASAFGFTASLTATDAPSGWLGVLAVLAALAVIADLAIERLSSGTQVPAIGGSRAMTRFCLAIAVAVFVALKFLLHVNVTTSYWGFGFWAGVILTAALVTLTARARQADRTAYVPPTR